MVWHCTILDICIRKANLLVILYDVAASNIPIVKQVEAIVDPEAFTAVRFAVATIPFIPFVFRDRDDAQTRNAGVELGFWISLGYILQALGLQTSDAGRASFLCMFTVRRIPKILFGILNRLYRTAQYFNILGEFLRYCLVMLR